MTDADARAAYISAIKSNGPCTMAQATYLGKVPNAYTGTFLAMTTSACTAYEVFRAMVRDGTLVLTGYRSGSEVYGLA